MRVILTGSDSQLGKALIYHKPNNIELISKNKKELDITNENKCINVISKYNPEWIINTAAYTSVDEAEVNSEKAFSINTLGVRNLAKTIQTFGGNLLHFSTDFVFAGNQSRPYDPYHKTKPINIYGKSKEGGEVAINKLLSQTDQGIIIRTSWLLGSTGTNFALTMLKLHKEKRNISVVCDQISSPTTTSSLSIACWKLIELKSSSSSIPSGTIPRIYHYSDAGIASWYDLAIAIGEIAEEIGLIEKAAKVIPIPSSAYPSKALRPNFSVLDCTATYKILGLDPLHWRKSLYQLLRELL